MKRLIAALAISALAIGMPGAAMAHGVNVGVSIGIPAPVHVAPAVVYSPHVHALPPMAAHSGWGDRRDWREHKWRERQRREHAWRERERREHRRHEHGRHDHHHWR